jgi:uncharacterized membrane protein (UPF0127 family)
MKIVKVSKSQTPGVSVKVRYCDTFFSRLRGLMFSKNLAEDTGVLLAEKGESRLNTSIHMLFMNFDLTVLWLDKDKVIVDKVLAKKWYPFYFPKKRAQYVLEIHPLKYDEFVVGERLNFQILD